MEFLGLYAALPERAWQCLGMLGRPWTGLGRGVKASVCHGGLLAAVG
jgi:hypothetical protein